MSQPTRKPARREDVHVRVMVTLHTYKVSSHNESIRLLSCFLQRQHCGFQTAGTDLECGSFVTHAPFSENSQKSCCLYKRTRVQ